MREQIIVQSFNGGILDDIRQQSANKFAMTKHFDVYSNPNRLTPHRSTEADTHDGSTATGMKQYDVRNFQLGSDGKLYGLGIQPGSTTRTKVVSKADPTDGNWTLNATAESGLNASASWRQCFIEWQGAFWMFGGTTSVSKWVIGSTFTDTVATLGTAFTHVAQGVIAPDNNLYLFYNNKVVRVSPAGAVTDAVLTLPSDGRIIGATVYGRYLAIGWAKGTTLTSGGYSRVFLWDLVSPDVSEAINWGEGQLMILGTLEGKIVGITDYFMSSLFGQNGGSLIIRMYAGAYPVIVKEVKLNATVSLGLFLRDVVIKANKIHFVALLPFNYSTSTASTQHLGIWAFGRKTENDPWALTLDYVEEAVDTSNFQIRSFGNSGNYWHINHSADGSITKTNDQATYTNTSIYESPKFNCGDISTRKKLWGFAITTAAQGSGAQVVVKYWKDGDTSFGNTLMTSNVDSSVSKEAVLHEGTTKELPEFHEIQFRIESTGGAEITGYKAIYERKKTLLQMK